MVQMLSIQTATCMQHVSVLQVQVCSGSVLAWVGSLRAAYVVLPAPRAGGAGEVTWAGGVPRRGAGAVPVPRASPIRRLAFLLSRRPPCLRASAPPLQRHPSTYV